eukprot:8716584-Pyramimonas_sp.AAC.1
MPPNAGLGQSDGPGTFRYCASVGVERRFRFDATKEKRRSTQSRGPRNSGASELMEARFLRSVGQ